MSSFSRRIRPFLEVELRAAELAETKGEPGVAFLHLQRAHVLGQASTVLHVRAHVAMFWWGIRRRQLGEVVGQLMRIVGAATKTAFGLVPRGNTGGSNVSPFRALPVPPDLAILIEGASGRGPRAQ